MSRTDLLRKIEAIANTDAGTLNGSEPLEDLPDWDSLAVLSVIALFDKELRLVVSPTRMYECRDVNAVIDLVGDRLAER